MPAFFAENNVEEAQNSKETDYLDGIEKSTT